MGFSKDTGVEPQKDYKGRECQIQSKGDSDKIEKPFPLQSFTQPLAVDKKVQCIR